MSASHSGTAVPVPDELEEALNPSWLTSALGVRFPGIKVISVEPGPVVQRVSTNARFRISFTGLDEGGPPEHLCVKGYFGQEARPLRAIGEPEARFYRDLARSTGVHTLRSLWAGVDPNSRHGVVITEDIVEQGATFLDPGDDFSPDDVARSVSELAALHAFTASPAADERPEWRISPLPLIAVGRGVDVIEANFSGPIGAGVPAEVADPARLHRLYPILAARASESWPCPVVHGDSHVGNFFLTAGRRPGLLDWQLVHRGPWYLDVGYHIASSLPIEARRTHERGLLRHYLEQVSAHGGDPVPFDQAWSEMRLGAVHGFYLWAITQQVNPVVTTELLTRLSTAVADHNGLSALEG